MTVREITEALLLVDEEYDGDSYEELPDIDEAYIKSELLDLCASLIETRGTGSPGSLTLHLAHFSVRQYILSHSLDTGGQLIRDVRLLSSNEATQNNILAKVCIQYLDFRRVWEEPREAGSQSRTIHAFRDYASSSWYRHVKINTMNSTDVFRTINALFCPGNKNWEAWRKYYDSSQQDQMLQYQGEIESGSPLFYASLLGFQETVTYLLEDAGMDVNHTDQSCRTAILAACSKGWIAGVKNLLQKGADLTIADNDGRTPLHGASANGHLEVVKLLLERGADLTIANITDGHR